MPLLYYWRPDNYFRDLDMGAGFHLNQSSRKLHSIEIGDSLWAFTRNKVGRYVLAAELVVKAKTINPPNYRYGHYRVWGDITLSRYFHVNEQPSIEQIIRQLSPKANARILGQSFQGSSAIRLLSNDDQLLLKIVAKDLPLEPRAHIFPEERLEAALVMGNSLAVEKLVTQEDPGMSESRRIYLYKQAPNRNKKLADELQRIYEGRCQICLWHPQEHYLTPLCQAHHIQWLSRGGDDDILNMALVCPNHHAAIHRVDAPLDYLDLAFDFGNHHEKILLNLHLK